MYGGTCAWFYSQYLSGQGFFRAKTEANLENAVVYVKLCPFPKIHYCPVGLQDPEGKDHLLKNSADYRFGLKIMIDGNGKREGYHSVLLVAAHAGKSSGERMFVNHNLPPNVKETIFNTLCSLTQGNFVATGGMGVSKEFKFYDLDINVHGMEFRVVTQIDTPSKLTLGVRGGE